MDRSIHEEDETVIAAWELKQTKKQAKGGYKEEAMKTIKQDTGLEYTWHI